MPRKSKHQARINWTENLDRKIVQMRRIPMHPAEIADKLKLDRAAVEGRLDKLKRECEYKYPRLYSGPRRKWTHEIIMQWRERVNKGTTQRERSAIKRQIALECKTSYDVVYQRCAPNWVFSKRDGLL